MSFHKNAKKRRRLLDALDRTLKQLKPSDTTGRRALDLAELEDRVLMSAAPMADAAPMPQSVDVAMLDPSVETQAAAAPAVGESLIADDVAVGLELESSASLDDVLAEVDRELVDGETGERISVDGSRPAADGFEQDAADAELELSTLSELSTLDSQPATQTVRQELVFVDVTVGNAQQLLGDLWAIDDPGRSVEIVLLSGSRDGVEQVSEALAGRSDLDAIHFVTHGTDRAVKLGSTWLQIDNLAAHSGEIARWGGSLTSDGDVLFYGCELAKSSSGQMLLDSLQALTGADIAASTDNTGSAILGGDWNLEFHRGEIETREILNDDQATWDGLLNTFVVTNTNDSGAGSLRQAMIDANALSGTDTITFNISGTGAHTITVSSALSAITDTVILDATTDDSFAANGNRPAIILDGNDLAADGLVLTATADGSTIRGLVIRDFNGNGILIDAGSDGSTISGNYIGHLTTTGTDAGVTEANTQSGIRILGANNVVGGTTAGAGNVLSGNNDCGLTITGASATGNIVRGNKIGTNADGTSVLANSIDGILIDVGAANNTIGGTTAAARNIISGNVDDGIEFDNGASGNIVQGNYLGTDVTGTINFGNQSDGVLVNANTLNNVVGGTAVGSGNIIAFNAAIGINSIDAASTGNHWLGNSIYSNGGLGIDFLSDGVTANDAGDADSGPNGNQNFPVLTSASGTATGTTVIGSLNSNAGTTYRIEFFTNRPAAADSPNGEGERYLGFTTVTTDGSGNAAFNVLLTAWVNHGDQVTATATVDLGSGNYGSSSEFGANVTATASGVIVVETTSDVSDGTTTSITNLGNNRGADGRISLREAIAAANNTANGASADRIVFAIPGALGSSGGHTINVTSALPTITQAVFIDGTTDNDFTSTPIIELNGSAAGPSVDGLTITGDGSTIRGLVINRFNNDGIVINGGDNNTIAGNFIGTNVAGTSTTGTGNTDDGIEIQNGGTGNVIGGTTATDRNVISGNLNDGIEISGSSSNTVIGNYIGTDVTGLADLGNTGDGVQVQDGSTGNVIGGTTAAARNVIAGNTEDGVDLSSGSNTVQGNYIGVGADGATALGNETGVKIKNSGNTIGGSVSGAGNVISSNAEFGILVNGVVPANLVSQWSGDNNALDSFGTNHGTLQNGATFGTGRNGEAFSLDGVNDYVSITASASLRPTNLTLESWVNADSYTPGNWNTVIAHGNTTGNQNAYLLGLFNGRAIVEVRHQNGTFTQVTAPSALSLGAWHHLAATFDGTTVRLYVDGTQVGSAVQASPIEYQAGTPITIGADVNDNLPVAYFDGLIDETRLYSRALSGSEISANFTHGAGGASNNTIQGNLIGTDATGTLNRGNSQQGIAFDNGATNNLVGGTTTSAGNTIAYSGFDGIALTSAAGSGNSLLGNRIFSNVGLGIDLIDNGVTANDASDVDAGTNGLQNYPVLAAAHTDGTGRVTIVGSLNSSAYSTFRVEFFSNSTGDEGQTSLGFRNVITDSDGNASFVDSFDASVAVGANITATATNLATGNTSEFSATRTTASALVVDTLNDVVDGNVSTVAALLASKGADGKISLREAIRATNNTSGWDAILLGAGTHTMSLTGTGEDSSVTGDFDIRDSVTIVGIGSGSTMINGQDIDRVLEVHNTVTAAIDGITITNGGNAGEGALLVGSPSTAVVSDSIFSNHVGTSMAGAIKNNGTLTLDTVRVTGNTVTGKGGGIYNAKSLVIRNSLIDGNTATGDGGGIFSDGSQADLFAVNTTISGNSSSGNGGGFYNNKDLELFNVTITANTSTGAAGGLYDGSSVTLVNTIIAGNSSAGSSNEDVEGSVTSLGFNLIGTTAGSSGWIGSDLQNTNPLLNSLANNGGPTLTHSLQAASPAINAGTNTSAPIVDQRDATRNGFTDIGAFEYGVSIGVPPGITITPTSLTTTEAGGTATFAVVLDTAPTANVTIGLTSNDTTEGTIAVGSLTFTTANWNVAQTVTVTGVDDTLDDGGISFSIVTAIASSTDTSYNGLDPLDVAVTNFDNDSTPVITSNGGGATASVNVAENSTTVATVTATDADVPAQTLTYSISGGADAARFTIHSSSGALTFNTAPNFESPTDAGANNVYDVQVTVSDGAGLTDVQDIAVTVTAVNDNNPVITSNGGGATAAISIAENTTAVTTVTATDADLPAGTLTYSISGGADAIRFTINSSTGALSFVSVPDYEAPADAGANNVYDVIVQASDGSLTDTQALAVTISNVNEGFWLSTTGNVSSSGVPGTSSWSKGEVLLFGDPSLDLDPGTNITNGTFSDVFDVQTFASGVDVDAMEYVTRTLTIGGGGNTLTLQAGDVLLSLDASATLTSMNSLAVTKEEVFLFRPTTNGNYGSGTFTMVLDDFGSIHGGGDTWSLALVEQATTVGETALSAGTFLFSRSGGAEDNDIRLFTPTGVGAGTTTGSVQVLVEGNDAGVDLSQKIYGLDLVHGPTTVGGVTLAAGTILMTANGNDTVGSNAIAVEAHDVFSLNFSQTTLGSGTAIATATLLLDGSDVGLNGGSEELDGLALYSSTINQAPVITSNGGAATAAVNVAENTTAVTTVTSSDLDGGTPSYSVSGGADAGLFTINSGSGVLAFSSGRNREVATDADSNHVYEVIVQVSDGNGGIDTQAISVTVTDVDEFDVGAITDTNGAANAVNENAANGTAVGITAAASDADATTNAITFSLDNSAGGRFTIDSATGVVTVAGSLDYESATSHTITVRATSADTSFSTQNFAISVNPLNDNSPVITSNGGGATAGISIAENTTAVTTVAATDADLPAQTLTYSISGGADAIRFTINSSTGVLTFNTAPNFESPTDAGANNVYDVQVTVSDGAGLTDAQDLAVTVTNVNEIPAVSTGGGISINEDTPGTMNLVINDPDVGGGNLQVALTQSGNSGLLSLSSTAGLSFTVGDGTSDVAMTFTGTQAAINTALATITYSPSLNFNGSDTLNYNINDLGNSGSGGAQSNFGSLLITVNAINDQPAATVPATASVNEFSLLTFTAGGANEISVADVEATTVQLTLSVTKGSLTLASLTGLSFTSGDGSADATMTFSGLKANVNAALNGLTFDHGVNHGGSSTLTALVSDLGATGSGGTLTDSKSTAITIVPFSPGIPGDAFLQGSYLEVGLGKDGAIGSDGNAPTGFNSAGARLSVEVDNERDGWATYDGDYALPGTPEEGWGVQVGGTTYSNNNIVTQQIAGNLSNFTSNASGQSVDWTGAVAGLDIDATYSVGVSDLYLDVFVTLTNTTGSALNNVYYYRNIDPDNNHTQNGIFATTNTIVSQGSDPSSVAYVTATQADGSLLGLMGFGPNARVTYGGFSNRDPVAIYNGTGGLSQSGTNTADQAVSLAYLIPTISAGGSTTLNYRYYFATSASITPVVDLDANNSNNGGLNYATTFVEGAVPVAITDADAILFDSDSANLSSLTVTITNRLDGAAELLSADTSGTSISASYAGGVLTLSGSDTLANYRQVLRTVQYENTSQNPDSTTRVITFQANDGTYASSLARAYVTISPVNDNPLITSSSSASVAENATAVLTVTSTDVDGGVPTYSISGGTDAGRFTINTTTGALSFSVAPDYENPTDVATNNVYNVQVMVNDGAGGSNTQAIAVTVTPVNDNAPIITSNGGGATAAISIAENTTAVTTVTSTDADLPTQTRTYSISGGADQSFFTIDGSTGVLAFNTARDYETPADVGTNNVYDVQVTVSDGAGLTDVQDIAITITPVNDNNPIITSNGGGASAAVSVAENTTAVTTVTATDADLPAQTLTFSITGGADQARFTINPTTGALVFNTAPDFETPTDVGSNNVYDVQITVSDGAGLTDVQNIAVTVTDVTAIVTVTNTNDVVNGNVTTAELLVANDGGDGISLREAILAANNSAGFDTIEFEIAGAGSHTITLTSSLPTITGSVSIDGTTDGSFAGTPVIELNGNGVAADGLTLTAGSDGSQITGLVITGMTDASIAVTNAENVSILGNSIHSNGGLGIDLADDGVTFNDLGDSDTGANGLQNFPVLFGVTSVDGNTTITGTLYSAAATTYRIEFFSSPVADATGFGEGAVFLGAITVTTDASGNAAINTTLPASVANGHIVSATATVDLGGAFGSTSEFGPRVQVRNAAPTSIAFLEGPVINNAEATDGTIVRVSLTGTGAVAGDVVSVAWEGSSIDGVVSATDVTNSFIDVTIPNASITPDGIKSVTAYVTHAGVDGLESNSFNVTVDTTAPATPLLNLPAIVNDTTPTLTGSAEPNSAVNVTIDPDSNAGTVNSFTLTTTAAANGFWTVTVPGANTLADGATFGVSVTASDAAGNTSAAATGTSLVDATAPAAPGVTAPGLLTNDNTPTFSGTAEANATVRIDIDPDNNGTTNNSFTLTTTADGSGNWNVTAPTPIADGIAAYSISAIDAAGNESVAVDRTVTIDTIPPAAPVSAIPDFINSLTPTLFGLAEAGTTVSVTIDPDNNPGTSDSFTLTTVAAANGSWNVTIPGANSLTDGNTVGVTITATDPAGNISPVTSDAFTVDTTPPAAPTIVIPPTVNTTTPTFIGTAEANAVVTVTFDPDNNSATGNSFVLQTTADSAGDWSVTVLVANALTNGNTVAIVVGSADAAGNASPTVSGSTVVVLGPTASPVITSPTLQNTATPTITGTAPANSAIEVIIDLDNNPVTYNSLSMTTTADANGAWSVTLPIDNALPNGATAGLSVTADTGSGPSAPTTGLVTIDTLAPDAPVSAIPDVVITLTPTLTGTAEPFSTIRLVLDPDDNAATSNSVTFTTTTLADGSWSVAVPLSTNLSNGSFSSVTITATDEAGNTSVPTLDTFLVDTTAPAIPTVSVPAYVNDTTPTIAGTAEAGTTITVTIDPDSNAATNDGFVLTTTADANGHWSVTVPGANALPDGSTASVFATSTDAAGHSSSSVPITFVVDATPPSPPSVTIPATTNDTTPTFTGTAEPNSTITLTIRGIGFQPVVLTTTVSPFGDWSITVPGANALPDGSLNNVSVTATDAAGNISAPTAGTMLIDTTAPLLSVEIPATTFDTTPTIYGTSEPFATISVTFDPDDDSASDNSFVVTTLADADGSWNVTVPGASTLAVGSTVGVSVIATDAAGNSPIPVTGRFDVVNSPSILPTINVPAIVNDPTPTITGTAAPNASVDVTFDPDNSPGTVNGFLMNVTADANGNWTVTVPNGNPFNNGDTVGVSVTATDPLGQPSGPVIDTFLVDTLAPAAPIVTSPTHNSSVSDTTPTFTGTAEANSTITVTFSGTGFQSVTLTTTADSAGHWTITVPSGNAIPDGTTITAFVTATDAAGNTSSPALVTIEIDTTAPVTPTIGNGSFSNDTTPTLTGTGEPGTTITLTLDPDNNPGTTNSFVLTTTVNNDGTWSATVPGTNTLPDGTTAGITLVSTDDAGNSTSGAPTTLTIDTTPPAAPVFALPNVTNDPTPTIAGTAEPNSTITVSIDPDSNPATDNNVTLTTIANSAGNWAVTVPGTSALPNGSTATVTVTATDAAGNTSAPTADSVLIDTQAPAAPVADFPNVVHDPTPNLRGTAEPNSLITLTLDPDNNPGTPNSFVLTTTTNPNGKWEVTVPPANILTDGNTVGYGITATDAAGNVSLPTTGTFDVNVTPPNAPSIRVTPTSGLFTDEAGTAVTFDIVLTSRPTANVVITLSLDSTEGSLSSSTLTFTMTNWNIAQTVTVTGVDDLVDDGDITYNVTGIAASKDPHHRGLTMPAVSVTNVDDDVTGINVGPINGDTNEDGGTAVFTVALNSQPTADVIINLTSSDLTEGTISTSSLTFTPTNWNTPQTVTVTGVFDYLTDGDVPFTIVTDPAITADPTYNGFDAVDVTVINDDGPNDAPIHNVPGPQTTSEDTRLTFSASHGNAITISDADADPLASLQVTLTATNGTLTLGGMTGLTLASGTGTGDVTLTFTGTIADINAALDGLVFDPNLNSFGPASVRIDTNDLGNSGSGGPQSDSDTVTITVVEVNDPPIAFNDTATTDEDTSVSGDVLANDTDPDNIDGLPGNEDTYTTVLDTPTTNGSLVLNSDGTFTYLPDPDYFGFDTFTYHLMDSDGAVSNVATMTITVNSINDAPVNGVPGPQTVDEDVTLTFNAANGNRISISDVDVFSGNVGVRLISTNGVLTLSQTAGLTFATGTGLGDYDVAFAGTLADVNAALDGLTFLGDPNYNGPASVRIITGDLGNSGAGGQLIDDETIDITINPVNDAPTATDDAYSTDEDTPLTIVAPGVLTNDNDIDFDTLQSLLVSGPAHGTLVLDTDGKFLYTPDFDYHGSDSFTYRAFDGALVSNLATVTLTVIPVNDAPRSQVDAYAVAQFGTITVLPPGVLGNDLDVEGDTMTVSVITGPTNGTLTLNPDGSFTYAPTGVFYGVDGFTYQATDGVDAGNIVTVTITVNVSAPSGGTGGGVTGGSGGGSSGSGGSGSIGSDAPSTSPPVVINPGTGHVLALPGSTRMTFGGDSSVVLVTLTNVDSDHLRELGWTESTAYFLPRRGSLLPPPLPTTEAVIAGDEQAVTFILQDGVLWNALDEFRENLNGASSSDKFARNLIVGTTATIGSSLTVGYVLWLLRGGSLLAGFVSTLPAWTLIDPLPILETSDLPVLTKDEEDDSLNALIDRAKRH